MAQELVARRILKMRSQPVWREGFVTDNGNHILDIFGLEILNPRELEEQLNQIVGVVCNGLFADRGADKLIIGTSEGIQVVDR